MNKNTKIVFFTLFFACSMFLTSCAKPVPPKKELTKQTALPIIPSKNLATDLLTTPAPTGKTLEKTSSLSLKPNGLKPDGSKLKIIIFSSTGGAGHISASKAMTEDLESFCDIKIVNVIEDVLVPLDTVKTLSLGRYRGEMVYNSMRSRGWIRSTNFFVRYIAPELFTLKEKSIEKLLTTFLTQEKPDILISVIPFVNYCASNVANKLGIPFLLVTTDNDLTNWLRGLRKIKHQNFCMTIGYDLQETRAKALAKHIPAEKIHVVGFPLKKVFRTVKDKEAIRKEWNIPQGKFVIMISIGGNGEIVTYNHVRTLARKCPNAHILACVGRNAALAKKLETLKLKAPLSLSIIPFTQKIADLMAVSDVLVTKPGPGIINEALYSNLPIIIDQTTLPVFWEKASIHFVLDHGFGKRIRFYRDLNPVIKDLIEHKEIGENMRKAMREYKKPDFSTFLRTKIKELYNQRAVFQINALEYQTKKPVFTKLMK